MVEKDKFLVVVSVLEGRKFPKRVKHRLITEARFDGELLATDPVDHVESPDFTQELAWELNKKGLHQHRLQRTSIKVQVYAVDTQSTAREAVGYVVLDLRSAQNQQTTKWYHLLHSKYHKSKPEIRLGIYIDDDKGGDEQGFKAKEAPARVGNAPTVPSYYDPKLLNPTLHETDGYYQIGPPSKCTDKFVLSVTVAFAANLPQLIPTTIPLPPTGYFFYYTLFGNDVTNDVFHDLLNPSFPAERASVRLQSSVEALQQFFCSQPGLQVHLCCGDQSLGNAEVPLRDLVKMESMEIYMKPVTIEGAFQLHPPNRAKQQLSMVPDDQSPLVGVSIILRKEDMAMSTLVKESPKAAAALPSEVAPDAGKLPSPKPSPQAKKSATPPKKTKQKQPKERRKPATPPPSPPAPHEGSYTETFESGSKTDDNLASLGEEVRKVAQDAEHLPDPAAQTGSPEIASRDPPHWDSQPEEAQGGQPSQQVNYQPQGGQPPQQLNYPVMTQAKSTHQADDPSSSTLPHVVIPPQANHLSFAIDMRSISSLQVAHHANVFLRYTYPFFGSAAPILTHPPVEVRKGTEVLLPQSYCAFDFATNPQQLQDTFNRVPLFVEVWDRQKDKGQSVLLGAAQVQLSAVLESEPARAVHSSGQVGWRKMWSDKLAARAVDGQSDHKLADLHVVLTLEDWGPITQKVTLGNEQSQAYSVSEATQPPPAEPPKPAEPRETLEYKAALELEMWKEQQEGLFENQLKDKETQYMKVLADEWKRRDKEREMVVKKKLSEYNQLEQQLRKTLADLEKREKQLAANEQDVLRLRTDMQREHDRKMTEMREASRRLKDDSDHQVQQEKKKTLDLEEMISKLKGQLTEAETKYAKLDKEFTVYKEQQSLKPEVRLQSEINLLTLEKAELERKMDAITKSKIHYKQQWGRALKELARIKQKEQTAARAQLRKQQQELEHMRLRYLAAEEKEVVKSEKKELEEIKNELNQLREQETQRSEASKLTLEGSQQPLYTLPADAESSMEEEHITRLIEERDTLLRTGVYTSEDRIITELDRQIRDAIAKRGSTITKKRVILETTRGHHYLPGR